MQGQGPHFPPTRKATIHIHRGEGGKGVKMGTLHWGGVGGGLAKPGSYIYSIAPQFNRTLPPPPPQKKKRHLLSVQTHVGSFHPCGCFRSNPGTTSFQMRMRIRNDVDLGYLVRWDPRRCSTPKGGEVISRVERSSVVS